jgi:AcrR family transcriptional regulator
MTGGCPATSRADTLRAVARIKADVRREEILRATCREVIARGFASTRVGDVAAALGVSTGLVFYHFTNKETLLGEAFRHAAGEDLDRLSATAAGGGSAAERLDRILRLYSPAGASGDWSGTGGRGVASAGSSEAWLLWIDAWGQALRSPELAEVSRQLDLRWKQTLAAVIREGVAAGELTCPDPDAAAWRLTALLDGLGVQVAVHRSLPAARLVEWVRAAAAAELGIDPAVLSGQA